MITIDKSSLIGKGANRECYKHPEKKDLCIKVVIPGKDDENCRDKKCYKHLEKKNISWDMIPLYHGDIETNLGMGSVFDLVLDHDGAVSKTLEYYLSSNKEIEKHYDGLSNSLYLLKGYLLQYHIITRTLWPHNIVCKKMDSGSFRLFVVDNIGDTDFIPICKYNKYFAKKKILRKWKRFEEHILKTYRHHKTLHRMLTCLPR
jgi:hypothetical protein